MLTSRIAHPHNQWWHQWHQHRCDISGTIAIISTSDANSQGRHRSPHGCQPPVDACATAAVPAAAVRVSALAVDAGAATSTSAAAGVRAVTAATLSAGSAADAGVVVNAVVNAVAYTLHKSHGSKH